MKKVKLTDLLKVLEAYAVTGMKPAAGMNVTGVTDSSGFVKKGNVFVCVKGYAADGHAFAAAAAGRGASVIVAENTEAVKAPGAVLIKVKDSKAALLALVKEFYKDAVKKMKIIGVTGTKGKTTVTYLIDAILKEATGKENAVIGTVKYKIGKREIEAENTTPSNTALHRYLEEAAGKGIKYFIMEVSSHALDQGRAANIEFDTAVITNITRDHLDYHRTYKRYFEAKVKILDMIKKNGLLVLNADDTHAAKILKLASKKKIKCLTFSLKKKADITAEDIKLSVRGIEGVLKIRNEKAAIKSQLVGAHNLANIMAAAGAAVRTAGIQDVKKALLKFKTVKGRLDKAYSGTFGVFVDFAHTPDAMEKVLDAVNGFKEGRIISVFGAGGERDRGKRPMMGRIAEKKSDIVIVTSDNPRSEDPGKIIKEILAGIKDKKQVIVRPDRAMAIRAAIGMAKPKDIVLLLGKGHETYQIVKGVKYHFNDAEEALKAVKEIQ